MNDKHIKIFIRWTIGCCVIIWLGFYIFQEFTVFSLPSLKALFSGTSLSGLLWAGYFKWAWKLPYLRKVLYKPNINGTWLGQFESNWEDEDGKVAPHDNFVLVIRQDWFKISIRAFTKQLKTNSHIESLIFDEEKGLKILAYMYAEKGIGVKSNLRQGAAELELAEGDDTKILEGDFWTITGTKGYVKVKLISEKEKVDSFDVAMSSWSNSESWQRI